MTDGALGRLIGDVASGRFPPVDGEVVVVPADHESGLEAVLAFTGHAVVATALAPEAVLALGPDAYGGACSPDVLRGLAGARGWVGVLDASFVALGTGEGAGSLAPTSALDGHPRVAYARRTRSEVAVLADERGVVTLGRGLAGRLELGVELLGGAGQGLGRALLRDTLGWLPAGEPLFAACSPGNARSLRALLAAGFRPFGSEVLLRPER